MYRMVKLIFAITLLIAVVTMMLLTVVRRQQVDSLPFITFVSTRGGNPDIFRSSVDGSHLRNLTHSPHRDGQPIWSPAGDAIIFVSERDGNQEIYRMRPDGTHQQNLSQHPARDWMPRWSPDGQWVAFVSNRDGNRNIFRMRSDSRDLQQLTVNEADDTQPAWSPDGNWIAFVSNRNGENDIFLMRSDGTELRQVSWMTSNDTAPTWSPDGLWIFFKSTVKGTSALYQVRPNGLDLRQLIQVESHISSLVVTPESSELIFTISQGERSDVFVLNLDKPLGDTDVSKGNLQLTSSEHISNKFSDNCQLKSDCQTAFELQNLTEGFASSLLPSLFSNGRWVFFTVGRKYSGEVYAINLDDKDVRIVTSYHSIGTVPSWSPHMEQVAGGKWFTGSMIATIFALLLCLWQVLTALSSLIFRRIRN